MRRILYAMLGVGFCCMALLTSPVAAQSARDDVGRQLQSLNQWLGTGPVAQGWHHFLRTDDLQRELTRGAEADPAVVAGIAARYAAATPGLERSQFANMRLALERWYRDLNRARGPQSLSQQVLNAKDSYVPPTRERLSFARSRLQAALQRLDQFLAREPQKREGWHAYLGWDVLQAELAKSELPNPDVLNALSENFYQNQVGLELSPFREARQALRDYADAILSISGENPQQAYQQRIDELAQQLDVYAEAPTDAGSVAIGNLLEYLSRTRQAPLAVEAVRRQYSQPNLYGSASQSLLSAAVARNVNEINPVREVILGTNIYGTAHTVGRVSLRTIPSQQNALVELIMNGHASSRNTGYNGPVTICSVGSTTLSATKRVVINDQGVASYPAVAVASTDTTITDILARRRLVERIAWKRAYRSESEAEAIASRRAEVRLQRRFDEQSAEALAEAQDNYYNRFRLPMQRRDIDPRMYFSSTHSSVQLAALQMGPNRLGAPTAPPPPGPQHDLNVRVHESMVGNAAEVILAGRTLTDERLAELVEETTGEVPEELQITQDKDPWSITFSQDRPFSVVFDGQMVTMAIHARQFTRGDRLVRKPILISARYRADQQGLGARLVRDGEVVVDYVDQRGRQSVQDVAFRAFMRRKFEALFKEEIVSEGLQPKGRLASVGKLALQRLEIDNGWMALSWDQASRVPYRPDLATSVGAGEN